MSREITVLIKVFGFIKCLLNNFMLSRTKCLLNNKPLLNPLLTLIYLFFYLFLYFIFIYFYYFE